MDEVVVRAAGLTKAYGRGPSAAIVLRDLNLTVWRGECLFLVGPSGSGKTTLLSILGCVLSPDAGSLHILGEDVTRLTPSGQARFRRSRVGFIFQRRHLIDALTAIENVRLPLDLVGRPSAGANALALALLSRLGLKEHASRRVNRLSMGQRQRVALARASAADPDLILADEPTASLDAQAGIEAVQTIKQLCRELHKTAVIVTHDPRILGLADRILTLADGRVVGPTIDGPVPEEVPYPAMLRPVRRES